MFKGLVTATLKRPAAWNSRWQSPDSRLEFIAIGHLKAWRVLREKSQHSLTAISYTPGIQIHSCAVGCYRHGVRGEKKKKTSWRQRLHSVIMAAGIEHFGSYAYKVFLTPFGSGHLSRVCCSCVLTYLPTTPDFFLRRNLRTGYHNCETTALLYAPVASIGDTLCKMQLRPCYKAACEPSSWA